MKKIFKKIIVKILTWQARLVLLRYKPKIIAITGSVGKTSTKDAIFTVLSKFKIVRKSDKSYNSEIGIPLTILGVQNGWNNPVIWLENMLKGFLLIIWKREYPEWLVLEVGAGKPNDIKDVAKWLAPDIVVITRFPDKPVHVEFFGSVDKIIEEKSALAFALKKKGTLILNHDDDVVYGLHEKAKRRTISYGENENATYRITYPTYAYESSNGNTLPAGINFKLEYSGNTFPVILPHVVGMHYIGSAVVAIAVAHEIGCDLLTSIDAISIYKTPPGRLSLIEGLNDSILIDDTYNSSPVAVSAALKVLKDLKAKRKIAVLGDMLELGLYTRDEHYKIGKIAAKACHKLFTVGIRSRVMAEGALDEKMKDDNIMMCDSSVDAGKELVKILAPGDVVYVKGSQSMRMERAISMILASAHNPQAVLVRQEDEWIKR